MSDTKENKKVYKRVGNLPKYTNPKEMEDKINEYFSECERKGKPFTISGLILYLGFSTTKALIAYSTKKDFSDIISKAKLRCCAYAEEQLFLKDKQVQGAIFTLTNLHGWKNKSETEHTGDVNMVIKLPDNFGADRQEKKLEDVKVTKIEEEKKTT